MPANDDRANDDQARKDAQSNPAEIGVDLPVVGAEQVAEAKEQQRFGQGADERWSEKLGERHLRDASRDDDERTGTMCDLSPQQWFGRASLESFLEDGDDGVSHPEERAEPADEPVSAPTTDQVPKGVAEQIRRHEHGVGTGEAEAPSGDEEADGTPMIGPSTTVIGTITA